MGMSVTRVAWCAVLFSRRFCFVIIYDLDVEGLALASQARLWEVGRDLYCRNGDAYLSIQERCN
jgi:hypothetical protein